jgi:hypothetical protein
MSTQELHEMRLLLEREWHERKKQDRSSRQSEMVLEKAKVTALHVEQVRAGVAPLREEATEEDRQARAREREAATHNLQIANAVDAHAGLQQRLAEAEERRRTLLGSLEDRERKRGIVVDHREQIRKTREEEERMSDELDRVEHELARDEQQFAGEKHREEEAELTAKSELIEAGQVVEGPKDKVTEFMDKYEGETTRNELQFECTERFLVQRKTTLEIQQVRWTELWQVKHEEADIVISELTQRIQRAQNVAVLATKAADMESEMVDLRDRIAACEASLKELQAPLTGQLTYLGKIQTDATEERERLTERERQLDEQQLMGQIDMADLDTQVVDIRTRQAELGLQRKTVETRGAATLKMLDLHELMLAAAGQRASLLASERESRESDQR